MEVLSCFDTSIIFLSAVMPVKNENVHSYSECRTVYLRFDSYKKVLFYFSYLLY